MCLKQRAEIPGTLCSHSEQGIQETQVHAPSLTSALYPSNTCKLYQVSTSLSPRPRHHISAIHTPGPSGGDAPCRVLLPDCLIVFPKPSTLAICLAA